MARHFAATGFSRRFSYSFFLNFTLFMFLGLIVLFPQKGQSAEATFTWKANTESSLSGYKIYVGNSSRDYNYSIDVGNRTTHTLAGLADSRTYYFAATAYDTNRNESAYSSEVNWISSPSYSPPVVIGTNTDEVIIDNGYAGTDPDGAWFASSGVNPYGNNSLYNKIAGDTYSFEASVNGPCQISLWWTQTTSRLTAVPVEIYDGNTLIDIIKVNQRLNGGKWNVLGTYNFSGAASIVIVSEGGGSTCADAVKFVPSSTGEVVTYTSDADTASDVNWSLSGEEVIIDNGYAGTDPDGTWFVSSGVNPYGNSSLYNKIAGDTYAFEASVSGAHQVSLWWTQTTSRLTAVPVEIYDGNTLIDIVEVNQRLNGGKWNVLGTYDFSGTASIVIVSEGVGSTCADAVRFVPSSIKEVIVDNDAVDSYPDGSWFPSSGVNPYGNNSLYNKIAGDTYTFEASVYGSQQVSLWWTQTTTRLRAVPVKIYDGNTLIDIIEVNQLVNGGKWNVLGTYNFSGAASLVIVSESGGSTCADAVRFVPLQ